VYINHLKNLIIKRPNDLKSNLKRQDNIGDLSKTNAENLDSTKKNFKSTGKGSLKTIGISFKETEDSTQFYNEINPFYQSEINVVNGDQLNTDDDIYDYEEEEISEQVEVQSKKFKDMLKITETLSFNDNFTEYTDTYKVHASINQYKMKFLGSMTGMNEFKSFLQQTAGYKLLRFWLDCEFYRDSMQDYDQIENMATRNRLFRDIIEKHVFSFAKKVHEKVSHNYLSNPTLTHNLFDRIQYDILRRLRSYWVPRFILNKLKQKGKDFGSFPLPPITPEYSRESTYLTAPSTSKTISVSAKDNIIDNVSNGNHKAYYNFIIIIAFNH
jgi:hypothetical protein